MDRDIYLYRASLMRYAHECDSCDACHELHIDNGEVVDNAKLNPFRFPCCVDHLNFLRSKGEICPDHPFDYSEKLSDRAGFYCEGCKGFGNGMD